MSRKRRQADHHNEPRNIAVHHNEAKLEKSILDNVHFLKQTAILLITVSTIGLIFYGSYIYLQIRLLEASNRQNELEQSTQRLLNENELGKIELEALKTKKEIEQIQKEKLKIEKQADIDKYKVDREKEIHIEKEKLTNEYKHKELDHQKMLEMEKLNQEKISKDRDYYLEEKRLQMSNQEKILEANKEIILKSLENPPKRKTSILFGLFTSEEDVNTIPEPHIGLTMQQQSEKMKNGTYVHTEPLEKHNTDSTIDEL